MDLGDEEDQCTEFAVAMTSGASPEDLCFKVCVKCVSCADEVGQGSAVEWCSKENGMVCMEMCDNFRDTVEDLNDAMTSSLKKDITELNLHRVRRKLQRSQALDGGSESARQQQRPAIGRAFCVMDDRVSY